tara:strand:- start:201 stop:623 length:423 start_codon:yes stop_codon:yes gene_type:complete
MKKRRLKLATMRKLFSDYIRTRDKWTCQVCHRNFEHDPRVLHASHHLPVGMGGGNVFMKYLPDNASAKCAIPGKYPVGCHQWMDLHNIEHVEWFKEWLGPERYDRLRELDVNPPRIHTDADHRELAEELKGKLKALQENR